MVDGMGDTGSSPSDLVTLSFLFCLTGTALIAFTGWQALSRAMGETSRQQTLLRPNFHQTRVLLPM